MSINFERAVILLSIIEKCAANPAYSPIGGEAHIELAGMREECVARAVKRADKAKAEKAAADLEVQQEADRRDAADLPRVIPTKPVPMYPEAELGSESAYGNTTANEEPNHVQRRI